MLRFRLPALSCLVCTGLFATIGAQADSWGNQGYGNPGYGNPVYGSGGYGSGGYGSGGYGSATTPYPRGFSDIGDGGWINSNEPQYRPLDPPASSRGSSPSPYRPLDTAPANPGYSPPSYGYPSTPYGGPQGGSYSAPNYPGGGYADPNQRDRGYPDSGYRDFIHRDGGYRDPGRPSAGDRYAPSGRYPDAYTPPPVIDWSSSLPQPRIDMEDFPFNHGIGEGLGTNARDYGADPRLPYDLPYRSRSLPRDDTPRRDAGNPAPARSMMDDLRGQTGGREAPIAPATDGASRYDYPIPPAPPRDLLPSPRTSPPEPVWTPPGHDQFRPLTADERQERDPAGGDRARRGDSAPSYYMPPMDEYGEQLRESARAFERRIGEPVPPSPRPTTGAPAESLPSAMPPSAPPSSPLSAPIFISPITEPASSKPGEAVPRPSPIDTTPSPAPATPPTTQPNPAPETRLPIPPVDAGAAKPVDEQFRPLEEEAPQPGGQAIENDLPPRVESSAETG